MTECGRSILDGYAINIVEFQLLTDLFSFVFLLEAGEASAIKPLVAFHHRLSEGIGIVEHMAGLCVDAAKLPLRFTFDVEGADLNDPTGMRGAALGGKKALRVRRAGFGGMRHDRRRCHRGHVGDTDAAGLDTRAGTGIGSVNAAPGLMGAAGSAAGFGGGERALIDGAIGLSRFHDRRAEAGSPDLRAAETRRDLKPILIFF
jgi:hypothetical protein